ncbi:hypothetical protein HZH66_012951 [Vespula vulgaris]|uniref:Uncharacterized protein n=1 Tax=Vespula vulgaris TaxID=7454 RepID=A0A834J7W5_VESVU|nr:hypothetical protein HZH66_012951 [Vespula vulgaris]
MGAKSKTFLHPITKYTKAFTHQYSSMYKLDVHKILIVLQIHYDKTFPGFNIDKALTIVATIADSTLSHVYNSGTHGS